MEPSVHYFINLFSVYIFFANYDVLLPVLTVNGRRRGMPTAVILWTIVFWWLSQWMLTQRRDGCLHWLSTEETRGTGHTLISSTDQWTMVRARECSTDNMNDTFLSSKASILISRAFHLYLESHYGMCEVPVDGSYATWKSGIQNAIKAGLLCLPIMYVYVSPTQTHLGHNFSLLHSFICHSLHKTVQTL